MGSTPTHPFRLRLANLCLGWLTVCLATTFAQAHALCQETTGQTQQEQELRQEQIAQRFLTILKTNPRLGTALDRVYSHVATRGKVDQFVDDLVGEGKAGAADSWMVAGLVQLTRGRETEAASCFEAAAKVGPEQSLAHYYLARSLMQLGDSRAAIAAFRRALDAAPTRLDALQISTGLGRLLQRLGRKEEAEGIWSDLEMKYPGDSQIQREIAQVLAEEGAYDAAIKRYEKLETLQSDRLRKLEFSTKVAELMALQGRHEEALTRYQELLAIANPGSWLYEDISRRIEMIFLARADYDGIYQHYRKWVESHPDDLDAVQRAVTFMLRQQAYAEAREILVSSLERAPSMTSLRLKLVDVLLAEDQTVDALKQLKIASRQSPDDPDLIVQLGQLTWQASEQDDAAREATATIWRRLLSETNRGATADASRAFQFAELLASVDHVDAAESYRRACELSPVAAYREQWGNYLFESGDQEQAIKVWEQLATEDSPTSDWVRLSEVFQQHELTDRAIQAMLHACAMQPTLGDRLRCARLLSDVERFSEAIEQIDAALPETHDQTRRLLQLRVSIFAQQGALAGEIARAAGAPEPDPYYLALLHSANRDVRESLETIARAIQSGNRQPLLLSLAVERFKAAGRTQEQLSAIEMLADSDAENRERHLKQKTRLLLDIGRTDEAFRIAGRILDAAPNQKSASQFFAKVCFECGKPDDGIAELRRLASRLYRDVDVVGGLAEALADNGRRSDAIEAYWRLFALQDSVAEKCDTVANLAKLHDSLDRVDVLLRRFESFSPSSGSDDPVEHDEAVLFKAVVYEHTNEHEKAISQIESLLQAGSQDEALLKRLVNLAVQQYDFDKAVAYQERVTRLEPTTNNRLRLAELLSQQGDVEKSGEILSDLAAQTDSPLEVLKIASSLLDAELVAEAEILLDNAVAASASPPWDLQLLRADVKLRQRRYEEAARIAEAIVALPITSEALSLEEQNNSRQSMQNGAYYAGFLKRSIGRPDRIARVAGLLSEQYERSSSGGMGGQYFVPQCFADAKIVAHKIRLQAEPASGAEWAEQEIETLVHAGDVEALWTVFALFVLQDEESWYRFGKSKQWDDCVRSLVEADQPAAKAFLAYALMEHIKEVDDREKKEQLLVELEELLVAVVGSTENDSWPGFLQSYLRVLATELDGSQFVASASRIEKLQLTADQRKALSVAWATVHRVVEMDEGEDPAGECSDENWQRFLLNMRRSIEVGSESPTVSGAGLLLEALDELEAAINDGQYAELQGLLWNQLAREAKPKASRIGEMFKAQSREAIARPTGRVAVPGSGFVPRDAIESLYVFAQSVGPKGAEAMLKSFDTALSENDLSPQGRHVLLVGKVHLQLWCRKTADALVTLDRIAATEVEPRYPTSVRLHQLLEQKDFSGALAVLDRITVSNYREAVDREYLASTCLMALGRLDEAKERIQELAGIRMRPDDLLDLSDRLAQFGLRLQAIAVLDRLSVRSSKDIEMLLELMRRYEFVGDRAAAVALARQALSSTVDSSRGGYSYYTNAIEPAVELLSEAGELDSIVEPLEQAYAERPGKGPVADRLITLYYAISRYEDATRIEAEIAAAGGGVEGMVARADELFGNGRFEDALAMYVDAIKQSPRAIELCEYSFLPLVATLGRADVLPELLYADGVPRSVWVDSGVMDILWDSGQHELAEELLSGQLEEAASLRDVETSLFDWPSEYKPSATLLDALGRLLVTNSTGIRARNELQQEGLLFPGVWDTSMMRCLDIVASNEEVNRRFSAEIADTNDASGPNFVATYLTIARGDYSEADAAFNAWLEAGPGDMDACASLLFCMHKLDSQGSEIAAELARRLSLRLFATDADWCNSASQEKLMRFADRHGHSSANACLVNIGLLTVVESLQSYPEYYRGSVVAPHSLQSVAKSEGFSAVATAALLAHGRSIFGGQQTDLPLRSGAIEPSTWYWQRAIEVASSEEVVEGLKGLVNHMPRDADSLRLMGEGSVSPDYFLLEALMARVPNRTSDGGIEVLLEQIAQSSLYTPEFKEGLQLVFANRETNKNLPTLAARVLIADRLLPEFREQVVKDLVDAMKSFSNEVLQPSQLEALLCAAKACSSQQRQEIASYVLKRLRGSGAMAEWLQAKIQLSEQFSGDFALDEAAAEELSLMIRGQSADREIANFAWSNRSQRIELAFAAVQLAWKFGYKDLSRELFAATLDWSKNQSAALSAWYEESDKTDISKMIAPILREWHADKGGVAANYSFLKELVFPVDNPNYAQLVSSLEFSSTSEYAIYEMDEPARTEFRSLAHWLVTFSREAGKTKELAGIAQDRLQYPESAPAALVVNGLLAQHKGSTPDLIAVANSLVANPAPIAASENHGSAVRVCVDIVEQLHADGSTNAIQAADALLDLLVSNEESYFGGQANGDLLQLAGKRLDLASKQGDASAFERAVRGFSQAVRASDMSYVASSHILSYRSAFIQRAFAAGDEAEALQQIALILDSGDVGDYWYSGEHLASTLLDPGTLSARQFLATQPQARLQYLWEPVCNAKLLGLSEFAIMFPPAYLSRGSSKLNGYQHWRPGARSISLLELLMRDAIELDQRKRIDELLTKLEDSDQDLWLLAKITYDLAAGNSLSPDDYCTPESNTLQPLGLMAGGVLPISVDIAAVAETQQEVISQFLQRAEIADEYEQDAKCALKSLLPSEGEQPSGWKLLPVESDDGRPVHARWTQRDGAICCEYSSCLTDLQLSQPMIGEFDIRVQVTAERSDFTAIGISLGGIVWRFDGLEASVGIVGREDAMVSLGDVRLSSNWQLRIVRMVDTVQLYVDDHLLHECMIPSPVGSPFLMLQAMTTSEIEFRLLEGLPERRLGPMPEVVKPIQRGLLGWLDGGLQTAIGQPTLLEPLSLGSYVNRNGYYAANPLAITCHVRSGELILAASRKNSLPRQIRYQRPLGNGDLVTLESHCEAGEPCVLVAVGDVAVVAERSDITLRKLRRDGTFLHQTKKGDLANVVQAVAKKGWNEISLRRTEKRVKIEVNGVVIGEPVCRPLSRVGLVADKQAARVRNVTIIVGAELSE